MPSYPSSVCLKIWSINITTQLSTMTTPSIWNINTKAHPSIRPPYYMANTSTCWLLFNIYHWRPSFQRRNKGSYRSQVERPNLFELIFSAVARATAALASNTSNTTPPKNISQETRKWPSHQKQQQLVKFMKLNMAANQAPVMHEASIGRVCRQNVNHSKNGSLSLNIG